MDPSSTDKGTDPLATPSDRGLAALVRTTLVVALPIIFVVLFVRWLIG